MEEPKDKRTKAYKEWKAKQEKESKGLGDTIESITESTGIKKVVKFVAGDDCGCDERKDKLNELFTYKKPECLTEDEYNILTEFYGRHKGNVVNNKDKKQLITIYNRVFRKKHNVNTSCTPCIREAYDNLKKYLEAYE